MGLFGAPHWWSHISYNDETWQSCTLPKEDPKKYKNHMTHPMCTATISPEISNFCYIKKYIHRLHFNTWFPVLLTFFEFFKVPLINMVAILQFWLATLGLLKIKLFWNKGYGIIIFGNDVTIKFLLCHSS